MIHDDNASALNEPELLDWDIEFWRVLFTSDDELFAAIMNAIEKKLVLKQQPMA